MKQIILTITLLSLIFLLTIIKPSKSACCGVPLVCKDVNRCLDCTESTPYCGKGKCNIFGCHCDGGCRKKDVSKPCWEPDADCHWKNFYEAEVATEDLFKTIDIDSDGKVSFTEVKDYIKLIKPTDVNIDKELFILDTNNDSFLTIDEIDGY